MRQLPNIIITGNPGVGKTTHCEILAERTGLQHLPVNQVAKDRECCDSWSDEYQSWIVDEDKLLDAIEEYIKTGGYIIDWHACDLFPQSWIDLVVVLRVTTCTLYDRLTARKVFSLNYPEAKLQENLDSEIMEVLPQEAREAFDREIVVELTSNSLEEMDANLDRIEAWVEQWKSDHAG